MSPFNRHQLTMQHYNIAKKQEVNPFENVNMVSLAQFSMGREILKNFLDKKSDSVTTRKIDDTWVILYDVSHLDFTTLLVWFSPTRGKFQFKNTWIHFNIEEDTMSCW